MCLGKLISKLSPEDRIKVSRVGASSKRENGTNGETYLKMKVSEAVKLPSDVSAQVFPKRPIARKPMASDPTRERL